jgi:hypothetical protein
LFFQKDVARKLRVDFCQIRGVGLSAMHGATVALNEIEGMGLADAEISYGLATPGVIVVFAFWAEVTFRVFARKV